MEAGRLQLPPDAYEEGVEGFEVEAADGSRVGRVAAPAQRDEGSSRWWLVSFVLGTVAAAAAFAAHLVIESAGGGIAWAIVALPIVLFAAAGAALLAGVDAPLAEKIAIVPASLLGYTPRAARRATPRRR
jgi:hypothetical protein